MKIRLLLTALLGFFLFGIQAQITTVGLIGSATPGGWDTDTDMTQDPTDTAIWTINIDLTDGAAKFRANDDWTVNWGNIDFPSGIGEQDGSDIPVFAGNYDITFNSVTGEYNFLVNSPIGIIGDATPGGWDYDTNMYYDSAGFFFITMDLAMGNAKFRANDDWTINWGSADFPTGIGTQGGSDIPIPAASTYFITLDTLSGEYSFTEKVSYGSIGLIGDATPGGWDVDTNLTKDPTDPAKWFMFIELTDGNVKFRADDAWTVSWGSTDFPTGVGVLGGADIPVVAGFYKVDFNSETGEYSFSEIGSYTTIGIIGDATPGGWDTDTDLDQDSEDPSVWTARFVLTDGNAKFRANDDWEVNWGSADFPIGIGVQGGADIPVVAGEYNITFNSLTGEYNFEVLVVFATIGIVGKNSPTAGWDVDADMTRSAEDEHLWTLAEAAFTSGAGESDDGCKFRAEDDWTANWGADTWPTGTGTQDGPNIPCIEGVFNVSFNDKTGEYAFMPPTGTNEILNPSDIEVFPNPTSQILNVDLSKLNISGDVQVIIYDMQGRRLKEVTKSIFGEIQVDVSSIQSGNYLLHITNGEFVIGKRFSVAK